MLTSASECFRAMFAVPMKESIENIVTMKEIASDILEAIIQFCYTGTVQLTNDNVDGIVAAASLMQLDNLAELCETYLLGTLNRSNFLEWLWLASHYRYKRLKEQSDTFVVDNFQQFVHDLEFLHTKIEALEMLLKHDELYVYSEDAIFDALIRWIEYDENNRKSLLKQLMSFVRFDQLPLSVGLK